MNSNEKKTKALGINYSTACSRLKKNIMFDLIKRLNLNNCYRCNKEILEVETLSIDHKEAWLGGPEKFWDLNNIAFSHNSCNSSHGNTLPRDERWKHGDYGYRIKKCRCNICRETYMKYKPKKNGNS